MKPFPVNFWNQSTSKNDFARHHRNQKQENNKYYESSLKAKQMRSRY